MKDVTYGQLVCCIRPKKAETHQTQFVVGGNRINYPGKVATPTAAMLVAKLLFNSVISTHRARFMMMDITNFYLMTPLKRPKYVKIKLRDIPEETMSNTNYVTLQLQTATYTLKQLKVGDPVL